VNVKLTDWLSFIRSGFDHPFAVAVEMLMIGTVVYTVLRFLRGTRGARLIRAVLIILAVSFAAVYLIAERFGLERINVLYPYFVLSVFLISLVAFQTELRRILLRIGEGGWYQRWMKSHIHSVEPIVAAVERLAKRKIGALIAIERTTEVGAIRETGVHLDAHVSTEILETIFWPGTPLHDLGAIIRRDRIIAAGCQFPLAESGEVDRSLGSRHRAAVGMSHEADAVVIVVSEQSGTISVAMRGKLHGGISGDRLRQLLIRELINPRPGKKSPTPQAEPVSAEQVHDGTG